MSAGESVIAVDGLTKTYGSALMKSRLINALAGVTLKTFPGEVFGLLGPNGAGKTTLIKILLGVVRASAGEAKLFEEPAGSIAARRRVGYLPESLRIDRHHSARSALYFYGRMSRLPVETIASRIDPLLELVGLRGRDREPVRRFSKGMYQRLGLAQALLHDPDLLILDEPTDGLDPVGRREVRRLLLELKARGKSIFLNSHILQEVELVCDRVAIMSNGTVRGSGTIADLTNQTTGRDLIIELVSGGSSLVAEEFTNQLRVCLLPIFSSRPGYHADDVEVVTMPSGLVQVKVRCDDQAKVDAAVDSLRRDGLSITGLKSSRRTLEDVFLSLVEPREAS